MQKVAIIFLINKWNASYSLTSVVRSQIRLLVKYGYSPRVLILRGCPDWNFQGKVDYRRVIPIIKYDYKQDKFNSSLLKKVEKISDVFINNLKDVDIVFTHDLIFLDMFLPYNLAFRIAAKQLKGIHWFHWCHSSPKKPKNLAYPRSLLYKKLPNSHIVSVTQADRKSFARMYNLPLAKIVTVYNPRFNQDFLHLNKLTNKIIEKTNLLDADIVNLMPTALSRMAKQPAICLYILAALKKEGQSVRMIFANSFSRGKSKEEAHLLHLHWLAQKLGLTDKEVFFTSELDRHLKEGCPEIVIKELFYLSNIYIHPSISETCSLSLLEAGAAKNLCILNKNLSTFKEIVKDNALWFDFDNVAEVIKKSYSITNSSGILKHYYSYYNDHKHYYLRLARRIIKALKSNPSLAFFVKVKKEFNDEFIFKKQIQPLLEK